MLRLRLRCLAAVALLAVIGGLSMSAAAVADVRDAGASLTEVGAIVVGGEPKKLLSHPSLPILYVSDAAGEVVVEVDVLSGVVARRFAVPGSPAGLALSDDGSLLYVALYSGKQVVGVDLGEGTIVGQSKDLDHPWDVQMVTGPSGVRLLAVTEHYGDVVSFLDPVTLDTQASIPTGYWPYEMAVDDADRRLYVVSYGAYRGGDLQCIDLDRLTQTWRRTTGSGSFGVCVDTSTDSVFVSDDVGETVSHFTASGDRLEVFGLVGRPMGVQLGDGGRWLATAIRTRGLVHALDTETGASAFSVEVGRLPMALEWVCAGYGEWPEALAVANEGDGTVSILGTAPPLAGFADVPSGHIFEREIRVLALRGVLSGYPRSGGSLFLPEGILSRAQLAKILVNALALHTEEVEPATVQYWDVPDDGGAFPFDVVQEASAAGIVHGVGTDPPRFGPWEPVTRLQVVRMVVRAAETLGLALPQTAGRSLFADVGPGDPDFAVMLVAHRAGLISGAVGADGSLYLRPAEPITRGQTAKIVCRLLAMFGEVTD